MNRLAVEPTPKESQYYSTSLNDRCGFVIVGEGTRRLLWITLKGKLEFFSCSNLTELLGILERHDVVTEFAGEWAGEPGVGDSFDTVWQSVLAEVRDQCGQWGGENAELVPERVKQQLLWAFDSTGKLDGERFATILDYEFVQLTPAQIAELASEMTARARPWEPPLNNN